MVCCVCRAKKELALGKICAQCISDFNLINSVLPKKVTLDYWISIAKK